MADPRETGLLQRFRPYTAYLRAVRKPLAGAFLCAIVYGLANGAGLPLMTRYVFPKIFPQQQVVAASPSPAPIAEPGAVTTPPAPSAQAIVPPRRLGTWELLAIALWLPVVFLVRGVSGYLNSYLIQYAGVRILESLRLDFFHKLQILPLSFLQKQSSGDLISRGLADTNQLQFTLTAVANELFKQPTTLAGSIGFLVYLALRDSGVALVLVCLAIIPVCVFPIRWVGRKLVRRAAHVQAQLGSVTDRFSENLGAAREVRAFGLEARETERFGAVSRVLVRAQMKVVKYAQSLTPAIEIISAVGISLTFIYAYEVRLPLGSFLAIIVALYSSYEPVKKLGNLSTELRRGMAALDRLEVVLNEPVSIEDPVDPVPVARLRGDLEFREVGFSYGAGVPALREVSVAIPHGTVCALVGPSGAGKTTFANLVPRFYDPASGGVCIDGIDVRRMRLADLRRNIAVVSQDPVLFNDTVLANLLLGRQGATRAEVEAAARHAFAHDFIEALPHGYETIVGERGASLSGGQRQRLAVARAFLRDAPILILDEATSALDAQGEEMVQQALAKLVVGKTVLVIAHRFSTIRIADRILVFDQGRIAASGTHAELYAGNPLYRSLYDRQR